MPFDNTPAVPTKEVGLANARKLSAALRSRRLRPVGFPTWNYSDATSCAIGLASRMFWDKWVVDTEQVRVMTGLSPTQAHRVFCAAGRRGQHKRYVTAEQVADVLDQCIAENEAI